MDAAVDVLEEAAGLRRPLAGASAEKLTELTLDALKAAIAAPGDHRLFRWGRLPGLFTARSGPPGEAATAAVRDGLLERTKTEARGKLVVEWVRATPRGVQFVHDRDSPRAVLRELKAVFGETRAGVPVWMADARDQVAAAAAGFERRAAELLTRLDSLATRVEDALHRAEAAGPGLPQPMVELVPWGPAALAYLDRRSAAGGGPCPLPELFAALADRGLTLSAFQDGLRRLAEVRAVALLPGEVAEPEFAFVAGGVLVAAVSRR